VGLRRQSRNRKAQLLWLPQTTCEDGCTTWYFVAQLLTSSSENNHFSLIHESLIEIKDRLGKLEQDRQPPKPDFEVYVAAIGGNPTPRPSTAFHDEPSFSAQSAQASLSAELSAEEAKSTDFDQEIQFSLASLKSLLQGQNVPSSVNDIYFPCAGPRSTSESIDLPPMPFVLAALKKATGNQNVVLSGIVVLRLTSF